MNKTSILAAALLLSSLAASADTLTGDTDVISAVMDRESSGLHVEANGQFTFTPNGNVIQLQDLTAFSVTLTSQTSYGWGIEMPIYTYTGNLETLSKFSFDMRTDIVTLTDTVSTQDGLTGIFTMALNPSNSILGDYREIATFTSAGSSSGVWGPGDPTPVVASSSVPEPQYAMMMGFLLACIGGLRFSFRKERG